MISTLQHHVLLPPHPGDARVRQAASPVRPVRRGPLWAGGDGRPTTGGLPGRRGAPPQAAVVSGASRRCQDRSTSLDTMAGPQGLSHLLS